MSLSTTTGVSGRGRGRARAGAKACAGAERGVRLRGPGRARALAGAGAYLAAGKRGGGRRVSHVWDGKSRYHTFELQTFYFKNLEITPSSEHTFSLFSLLRLFSF